MPRRLLALLLALAAPLAPAMEFTRVGSTLVMSGPVVGDDLARLKDHLMGELPRLVVLHDSPGGDLWNGQQLAHLVRSNGLETAVSGKCESACGLVYLAGTRRWFSDGKPLAVTMVGLHGAWHSVTRQPLPDLGASMAWLIRTYTGGKYPRDLLDRTVYPKDVDDIIYAFHPARFKAGAPRGVMECLKQGAAFKCSMLDGLDALAIGVTTEPEVLQLHADVKALLERR